MDTARRADGTLARDVDELLRMQLIRREAAGCVANRDPILAFLAARRTG